MHVPLHLMHFQNGSQTVAINIDKAAGRTYLEASKTQACCLLDEVEKLISGVGRT
jgi:hypothetical protein